ncbi:hypothetical protein [Streptomyces sp. NPDC058045]|uniref:hypothetical protein n=1 Tax=Streptomyces sp. NPDC058045 TaxID=3346311 RepID=UPI0036EBB264
MPYPTAGITDSAPGNVRRSRSRRAGESAFGLLLLARQVALAAVAVLLVVAGIWASWGTAQYVMSARDHERGTLTVTSCGSDACRGTLTPRSPSSGAKPRTGLVLDQTVGASRGDRLPVVVKPGTSTVLRTGLPGLSYAWLPLGGALVLAAVVAGGGLRLRRTAWAAGLLGLALLSVSFATA